MTHAMQATVTALEQLLDVLRAEEPDLPLALEQVEALLQQEPCVEEQHAAATAAASVLERLLIPLLSQDASRLERANALQTLWAADVPSDSEQRRVQQAEQEACLQEMRGWVVDRSEPQKTESASSSPKEASDAPSGDLPHTLFSRLTEAVRLLCESETALMAEVDQWVDHPSPPWERIGTALQRIYRTGHRAAESPWIRQRRAFYDALLSVAEAKPDAFEGDSASHVADSAHDAVDLAYNPVHDEAAASSVPVRPAGRVEAHRTYGRLHGRIMALHQEARSLTMQQDESRERAEHLKARLNDLESTLMQARRAQFLDPDTGIPDRFAFSAHLQRYLERAVHLKEPFSLLLFHCDRLEGQLQTLREADGAQEGRAKRLVTGVVEEMRRHMPAEVFLATLTPERFVALLPKDDGTEGRRVGAAVEAALTDIRFSLDGTEVVVNLSFDCAAYQPGMDAARMLAVADQLAASARAAQPSGPRPEARRVQAC